MDPLSSTSLSLDEISPALSNSSCEIVERLLRSPQRTSSECESLSRTYVQLLINSAEKIKEDYTYVCQDIVKEFKKYDTDPYKYFARFAGEHSVTGRKYDLDIGYERFLAPEIFFNPEIYSSDFLTPLPEVVDTVIQTSPIDVRRGLYKNIVLSGGSTMFKDFGKRLQRDVKAIVDGRIAGSEQKSGSHMKSSGVEVNVISHKRQRYAVWYGGSLMASTVSISCLFIFEMLIISPNSTMSRTASLTTRSMVPRLSGVSRSLVVLSSLGCYMQEYRRSSDAALHKGNAVYLPHDSVLRDGASRSRRAVRSSDRYRDSSLRRSRLRGV